ncbi:MAG: excinuclease ABC subunit UvrA [Candidatus Omnitrophica bacterium]|nr:excinuclease ABC subunit UvrA [Candidatus Omnitrophota bacterium]
MAEQLIIRGAREHNLKNISVSIPRNHLVVITGLSGSGKSSLAFDTIYAEGQRRYIETLSPYVRQFLDRLKKPDVDHISGLSPSISIEQKNFTHNPRSTVATLTEIFDFLRLLFAKLGDIYCYKCALPIGERSVKDVLGEMKRLPDGTVITVLAPLVRGRKGEYKKLFEDVQKQGYAKLRVDGKIYDVRDGIPLDKNKRHDIEVVIDRFKLEEGTHERLKQALGEAFELAGEKCLVRYEGSGHKPREVLFSQKRSCPKCGISFEDLTPNMFSFNSPYGACQKCRGLGRVSHLVEHYVIQDSSRAIFKGALNPEINFSFNKYFIEELAHRIKEHFRVDLSAAFAKWPEEAQEAFFWGSDEFQGLYDELRELYYQTSSETIKEKVRKFLREDICQECEGRRIQKKSLSVRISGKNIVEISRMSVLSAEEFFGKLTWLDAQKIIATPILKEIKERLGFLKNVGLGYITLDRPVTTLTAGELQRIRLASQISVGLTGVLYVLDEPSVGLHPRDLDKLLHTLRKLKDLKNTVVVVEHDESTIRSADYVIDLGPSGGEQGGYVVGEGPVTEFIKNGSSQTAQFLRKELSIAVPKSRVNYKEKPFIEVIGASEHNLKNIHARFPLNTLTCVTGVSGSGKSTLIHDILFSMLHNKLWKTHYPVGKHKAIKGGEYIDKIIGIDQSPIGRTPRSNPATYTDMFSHIRKLYSLLPEARLRSFTPSRFSFNVPSGRCEICEGDGYQRLAMNFMPDVFVLCEACRGKRYNEATLEVKFHDKDISQVLDMPVDEALSFFSNVPALREKLHLMKKIGLGYVKLGQPSTTLSGGEAQRIKLAYELSKRATGNTLYILDEPSTGLHFADIDLLLHALLELRDAGNSIIVIEHNLDFIKTADYIVDLGPEGGDAGGRIMAEGSPEEIIRIEASYTGSYLKPLLNGKRPPM